MAGDAVKSNIGPGALVTVAYVKSLYDEKGDHLGMFTPLILDAIAEITAETFTVSEVQEKLASKHQIAMPQDAVTTLLHRTVRKGILKREHGVYRRHGQRQAGGQLEQKRASTHARYVALAAGFRQHAETRKLRITSDDEALTILTQFLESQHVGLLLGAPITLLEQGGTSDKALDVAAEFVQAALQGQSDFRESIRDLVEALVLYRVAFLPPTAQTARRFSNLRVFFDSGLVRQALGYEGTALRALANDTLSMLKGSGIQCLVFDKTVDEIRRILNFYENRLGTEAGRMSIRPGPMARHFLTQRYSPSDVREMSALLEQEIQSAGLQISRTPKHEEQFTFDEKKLAQYLADPKSGDESESRVLHDIDCVAAVLTLRKGKRSVYLEDAAVVFVSASSLMLRNVRRWYREEDATAGIDPAIHIRALSNQAWLKKPTLVKDFKIHELVALCSVALRPSANTWNRFRRHLESLEKSNRITSDEITVIVVSALSDRLLLEAELDDDDDDVDAVTLDDIVERVKTSYGAKAKEIEAKAQEDLAKVQGQTAQAIARAAELERSSAERFRRMQVKLEGRARQLAGWCANGVFALTSVLLMIGAVVLIAAHPFHNDWIGWTVAIALVVFVGLETLGILEHAKKFRDESEARLTQFFSRWLGVSQLADGPSPLDGPTEL